MIKGVSKMAQPEWAYTFDQADPCTSCVQWRCPVEEEHDDMNCVWEHEWKPYLPDGSVAPRVFDGTCGPCARAIEEYEEECRRSGI